MTYEIVAFHAENPDNHFAVEGDLNAAGMFNILLASARRFDSSVALTILTTPNTDLSGVTAPYRRVDHQIDFSRLMLERTRAQVSYVSAHLGPRPLALLDSDVIVNMDLLPVFARDFDIGLTWRPTRQGMPFNGGVLFVNNKRPQASKKFWADFLQVYESEYHDRAVWYGDQLALTKVVGAAAQHLDTVSSAEANGIRYAFLPCTTYNYTPDWRARALLTTDVADKILHFKERSRRLMEPFWRYRIAREGGHGFASQRALLLKAFHLFQQNRSYRDAWNSDPRRALKRQRPKRSWRHLLERGLRQKGALGR